MMKMRDFQIPKKVEFEQETLTQVYGRFVAEPFERGFGMTIGNSLRRVLLSSIVGAAVTSVRIEGVLHEFSSITGVKEDVTDIILNLKNLRLKVHSDKPKSIHIKKKGAGEVTGKDLIHDADVEILTPDLHIATLDKDASLELEVTVQNGRGYVPAERNKDEDAPIGVIPVDSLFSPVRKVNCVVENSRVGRVTDYDKLTMEITTDGSIKPDEALAYAAKVLKDHLSIFITFEERDEATDYAIEEKGGDLNKNLFRSVNELELSVRAANCLKNANIKSIADLVQKSEAEMLKTKNFGRKSLNEIKEILSEMGLSLGMKLDQLSPEGAEASNDRG